MPGRSSPLSALQTRKQLLLLEAEVHRALFQRDCEELKKILLSPKKEEKMGPAQALLANADLLWAGLSSFWRFRRGKGSSYLSHLMTRAGLFALRWFVFRDRSR